MDSNLTSPVPHTPAATQPEVSYVPSEGENELILLSREWMRAAFAQDDVTLGRLMAPEYTLQIWDASRAAQNLESWMTTLIHRLRDVKFDYTSINARTLGEVGIVYSTFRWTGILDDIPFSDTGFMADVWTKRNGTWQVISRRSAPQQQISQLEIR